MFWSKQNFWVKDNFGSKKFRVQQKFWSKKKFWVKKNCWSNKILGPKKLASRWGGPNISNLGQIEIFSKHFSDKNFWRIFWCIDLTNKIKIRGKDSLWLLSVQHLSEWQIKKKLNLIFNFTKTFSLRGAIIKKRKNLGKIP